MSEGLALLRRTLDRKSGGRERWLPLYLPLAGLSAREVAAATGTAALWSGALTMKEPGPLELELPLEIVAGPNPLALAPDSAPLSGVLMPGTSPANLRLRASLGGGGLWVAPLQPAGSGAFRAAAPPGPVELVRADPGDPLGPPVELLDSLVLGAEGLAGLEL